MGLNCWNHFIGKSLWFKTFYYLAMLRKWANFLFAHFPPEGQHALGFFKLLVLAQLLDKVRNSDATVQCPLDLMLAMGVELHRPGRCFRPARRSFQTPRQFWQHAFSYQRWEYKEGHSRWTCETQKSTQSHSSAQVGYSTASRQFARHFQAGTFGQAARTSECRKCRNNEFCAIRTPCALTVYFWMDEPMCASSAASEASIKNCSGPCGMFELYKVSRSSALVL